MGSMGRCCCPCECLELAELPSISITGMTGGDWVATDCCWTKTFTFNASQATTTVCTGLVDDSALETIVEADIYYLKARTPPEFSSEQDFPLPLQYCCASSPQLAGTLVAKCKFIDHAKLKVSYRRKDIVVRASKQNVVCDGVSQCKLVLSTDYRYEYASVVLSDSVGDQELTATATGVCFDYYDDPPAICNFEYDGNEPLIDCSGDIQLGAGSQVFSFTRIKQYDEWPEGDEVFNNESYLPSGCEITICSGDSFVNQVCISALPTAYCFDCGAATIVEETFRPVNQCDGLQEQYIYSGCGTPFPTVDFLGDNEPDSRLCSEITRNVLLIAPPNTGGCAAYTSCEGTNINVSSAFRISKGGSEFLELGDFCVGGANPPPTECKYFNPCGGDSFFPFLSGIGFLDVTNYSYTKTCNGVERSVCVNAPSWTITFA